MHQRYSTSSSASSHKSFKPWCAAATSKPAGIAASERVIDIRPYHEYAEAAIRTALKKLVGARVVDVLVEKPGGYQRVLFALFLTLQLLCDHQPVNPSFDGIGELITRSQSHWLWLGNSM